ncbi:hypothetical protein RCCGEPOP_28104, partial [Rhizobium sp. Pop5]
RQKESVAAPCLISACMALAPTMITPSSISASVYQRAVTQGGNDDQPHVDAVAGLFEVRSERAGGPSMQEATLRRLLRGFALRAARLSMREGRECRALMADDGAVVPMPERASS